jgi:RNA polymerase sigma-70 factor (ECF subfamily)
MMARAATITLGTSVEIPAQFDSCYREHWSRVFRWSLRYAGGNATWAEDLAHDVFLRLLENLPELSRQDDLGGWLYRTTANMAISRLRRERSWVSRIAAAWRTLQSEAAPSAEVIVVFREEAAKALATLTSLPPRERVVVSMKLLDGKSQRDIAEALNISEGYVSKLLKRGLDRARADGWGDEVDHE